MSESIVWYDYETFGATPSLDRPAQFAAIRTDEDLNEIEAPHQLFCKPTNDYLPHPQACLITGITPQDCLQKGIPEVEFIKQINQIFSQGQTCTAGYNSIRFDDEVTRYTLYRNFLDPYEREWKNGNSRWDLLDVMRCAYALRPDGIEWPKNEEGKVSFKLEDLTEANGISHGQAHDAVVDVRATISIARLLKQAQPKLFKFLFEHRFKYKLAPLVDVESVKPLVHISGMYGVEKGCMAVIVPIAWHPTNKNSFIAFDISNDPQQLFDLTPQQIQERIFTKKEDMPEGVERLPIKEVHLNKSPVLAPANTLTPDQAERWNLSGALLRENIAKLKQAMKVEGSLESKMHQVFEAREFDQKKDVDTQLYSSFWSAPDKRVMEQIHGLHPDLLAEYVPNFQDPRGAEMFFRFRARNYPDSLTFEENERWMEHCRQQLFNGSGLTYPKLEAALVEAAEANQYDANKMFILQELQLYAESIYPN